MLRNEKNYNDLSHEEKQRRLTRLAEEMVEFPNGNIAFKHHFTSDDGSTMGW